MNKATCFYHAHCLDGFGAAYCLWKINQIEKLAEIEFVPIDYNTKINPEDYNGQTIIIVDFSFSLEVTKELIKNSFGFVWLDHHASAEPVYLAVKDTLQNDIDTIVFDKTKSGVRLAWEHFTSHKLGDEIPPFVKYIEDRDLWKWQYKETLAFTKALNSYPMEFEIWDNLFECVPEESLVKEGETIQRFYEKQLESIKHNAYEIELNGIKGIAVNANGMFTSELGNILSESYPFALVYSERKDGKFACGLRSNKNGVNVRLLTEQHGGGGHNNAAGMVVDSKIWNRL